MAKKNEKTEPINDVPSQDEINQLMEQQKKNQEEIAKNLAATTQDTTATADEEGNIPPPPIVEVKKEVEQVNPIVADGFDEDGNPIVKAEEATTTQLKSSLAKLLKAQFEDLELEDEDEDKAIAKIKEIKEQRDLAVLALQSESDFEKSQQAQIISGFLQKSDEEKYRDYLVATNLQKGYPEARAKQMAEKEIARAKEEAEAGDEDIISIEAERLTQLAKNDYLAIKKSFVEKKAEALKINISQNSLTEKIKDVKDILAKSDTFLGINFKTQAKKKEYLDNTMKTIESGEWKKLISDPNELAEFLLWKSNRKAYEARLKNIGRSEVIYEKSPTPTIPTAGGGKHQEPVKSDKKFNPSGW